MPGYGSGHVESSRLWKNRRGGRFKNKDSREIKQFSTEKVIVTYTDKKQHGEFKGVHHGYLGLALTLLGFIVFWKFYWPGVIMMMVGIYLQFDDFIWEHAFGKRTPVVILTEWLWKKSGAFCWICTLWDKILGKR